MSYQNPPNTVKASPCPEVSVNQVPPTSPSSKCKGLMASFQPSNPSSKPQPPVMASSPPCHIYGSNNNSSGAPNYLAPRPLIGDAPMFTSVQNPGAWQPQLSSQKSNAGVGLNPSSSTFERCTSGNALSYTSGTFGLVSGHSGAWPTHPPGVSSTHFGATSPSRLCEPLSTSTTNVPGTSIPSFLNVTSRESCPAQQGFEQFVGKKADNSPTVPSPNVSLSSSIEKSQKHLRESLHIVNEPTTTVPKPNSSSSPAKENSGETGHGFDDGESDIANIEDTEDEAISHEDYIASAKPPIFTLRNKNGSKRNHDVTTNRTKLYIRPTTSGHDTETSADETDNSPSRKRQKPSLPQSPHCEYHCPANSNPDSDLPIVHAVITNRRHRRNGPTRYRLQKLFSDKEEAAKYAAGWTWEKYSKFEDSAKTADLNVLGENDGIGFYTPASWNEAKGMNFGACVQRRYLE